MSLLEDLREGEELGALETPEQAAERKGLIRPHNVSDEAKALKEISKELHNIFLELEKINKAMRLWK